MEILASRRSSKPTMLASLVKVARGVEVGGAAATSWGGEKFSNESLDQVCVSLDGVDWEFVGVDSCPGSSLLRD